MSAPSPKFAFDHRTGDLLAPWTYRDQEFLALEIEHLFKTEWLLAGHLSDIPRRRDYLTVDAAGERGLIVRGNDDEVRGFHNVCRHRGARLLDFERGQCSRMLTCPFHGWTYNLDGSLASVPASDTFPGLDTAKNGLVPLELEIWMGFIFVRFGGGDSIASVAQTMQPVAELIAPYQLQNMQPTPGSQYRAVRPYNWKTIHDIDNEGYHVPGGHPSLQQLYGKNYRDDVAGSVPVSYGYLNDKPGKLWSVRHYQKLLPEYAHLPPEQRRVWIYVGMFPSTVLALYPDSMEFYMSIPLSPDATRFIGCAYALPDERRSARAARYLNMRINRITDREDESFVWRMQDTLQSGALPTPHLSTRESGVRQLHKEIQRILPVATLANPPPPGTVAQVNAQLGGEL